MLLRKCQIMSQIIRVKYKKKKNWPDLRACNFILQASNYLFLCWIFLLLHPKILSNQTLNSEARGQTVITVMSNDIANVLVSQCVSYCLETRDVFVFFCFFNQVYDKSLKWNNSWFITTLGFIITLSHDYPGISLIIRSWL